MSNWNPRPSSQYTDRLGFKPWEQREKEALTIRVEKLTRGLPPSWVSRIHSEWSKRREKNPQESAKWGFATLRTIRRAEKLGIHHGDSDSELCKKAEREARQMSALLDAVATRVKKLKPDRDVDWLGVLTLRAKAWAVRLDFRRRGIEHKLPEGKHITRAGIVSRATDPIVWRRILRGMHSVAMEGTAIALGLVRAGIKGGCYVSQESVKRRRGQRARNRAALAATVAVNERGEADTLAEIASRGTSNGEVRRAELMTRISGFEVIANDLGHRATFVTVTCPSRMHKWKKEGGHAQKINPSYDGTLPNQAQAYLARQYARLRAAAARAGLALYGFRIAEPHHDGCPHWHLLMWHAGTTASGADAAFALGLCLMRYFIANDSPHERGADRFRVKVEAISSERGSAAAYIAKYVAKNIDGHRLQEDLFGNPAFEAAERVEAWASTWRIRQFQQIGGAPVGVWRELRRVHPGAAPMDAPQALHDALMMVNVTAVDAVMGGPDAEADKAARIRAGWAAYVMAQGGPLAKRRDNPLRVMREETGEANRYGELGAQRVVGVSATSHEKVTYGIVTKSRLRVDEVESERATWVTASFRPEDAGSMPRVVQRLTAVMAERQAQIDERRQARIERGEAARTWTRVNNCTGEVPVHMQTLVDIFGTQVCRTPKQGKVFRWKESAAHRGDGLTDPLSRAPVKEGQSLKANHAYDYRDPGRHQDHS